MSDATSHRVTDRDIYAVFMLGLLVGVVLGELIAFGIEVLV